MKKLYYSILILFVYISFSPHSIAQNLPDSLYLGKKSEFRDEIQKKFSNASLKTGPLLLRVANGSTLEGKINFHQSEKKSEYVIGEIQGIPSSSFHLKVSPDTLTGSIILKNSMKAYSYYSDKNGNAYVKEVDINKLICINMEDAPEKEKKGAAGGRMASTISSAMLNLQSLPGAAGCVLLDFDGHYVSGTFWNNGNPINAAHSGMTDAQILEHWEILAEDYRPFNLNITTSEAVFNSYPKSKRIRCIVTPTNTAAPGAGGVALLGSFRWNDDTPCWTFITSGKTGGEASSHEVGHTLGLDHDGRTTPKEDYYTGHDNWAPIMGISYYKSIAQWSRGEYSGANNQENDMAIISSSTYGIGYRADDHGNSIQSSTSLVYDGSGNLSSSRNKGVIERSTDVDYFSFSTAGGNISLNVNTVGRHGNMDILVKLFNQAGTQIGSFNPSGLNALLAVNLSAGTYYISVDGTGTANPATTGYSDYGSVGSYTISGTIPPSSSVQPVGVTNLSGIFYLQNRNSGLYLDVSGSSTSDGANIVQWSFTGTKNQQFEFSHLGNGEYRITPVHSGKSLDIQALSTTDGGNLYQWIYLGGKNQKFIAHAASDGFYKLTAKHSGKILEVAGALTSAGANVQQWSDKGQNSGQWKLVPVTTTPSSNNTINTAIQAENYSSMYGIKTETTRDTDGGLNVGWIDPADWMVFNNINIPATGSYKVEYRVASPNGSKLSLDLNNGATVLGAVNIPSTGGWQNWTTVSHTLTINAGTHNFRIYAPAGAWNINWFRITAITTASTTIQAEDYSSMYGINTENTKDTGGGLNVGWIGPGDWMAYNNINIPATGSYKVEYRVASPNGSKLSLDLNKGATVLGTVNIPSTGGWQNWTTVSHTVTINAGTHNFRIYAPAGSWNINWFRITRIANTLTEEIFIAPTTEAAAQEAEFDFYPNPAHDQIHLVSFEDLKGGQLRIFNDTGLEVYKGTLNKETIDVSSFRNGIYFFVIVKDGQKVAKRFIKN